MATMETKVDDGNGMNSINGINFDDLNMGKQKELLGALQSLSLDVLGRDFQEKMQSLQQSLDHRMRENEANESQIAALKQHNDFLLQSSNQWNCRFNESQIALLDMKEENLKLRTELSTMKTLYDSMMNLTQQPMAVSTADSSDDDEMSDTVKQYMEENKELKRENIKYLNQLKEANTKYTECNTKYIEMSSLQRAQQNELRSTRSHAAELEEMLQDTISEIRNLERETADLREALSEVYDVSTDKGLYDADGNVVKVTYSPDAKVRKRWRKRSVSSGQSISSGGSRSTTPMVLFSDDHILGSFPILDGDDLCETDAECTADGDRKRRDSVGKIHDLFQAINDELDEIEDCVDTVQRLQKAHSSTTGQLARASHEKLTERYRRGKDADGDWKELEKEDEMGHCETMSLIQDSQKQKGELHRITDIVAKIKFCLVELQQSQKAVMEAEKERFDSMVESEQRRFDRLMEEYKQYQMASMQKIKQLTKEIYGVYYKKYSSYKHIYGEMLGNVGDYTVDAIMKRILKR